MTLDIIATAKNLGVAVHDHIIIGRDGHASLRGMKLDLTGPPGVGRLKALRFVGRYQSRAVSRDRSLTRLVPQERFRTPDPIITNRRITVSAAFPALSED